MKSFLYLCTALTALFFITQAFTSRQVSNTETHSYEVLKSYPDFEIRRYEPALFSVINLEGSAYRENSGTGFRILAGYIFGGNERGEKIAMTSPVVMEMKDSMTMKFMVPSGYDRSSLPQPNHSEIEFEEQGSRIMAAVTFGGWANDDKISSHKAMLEAALRREGIAHKGVFSYLGYNPPYEVTNRKNEVVVELTNFEIN